MDEILHNMEHVFDILRLVDRIGGTGIAIIGAFIFLFGLIQCFFGLKLFKIMVGIVTFFAGFFVGLILFTALTDEIGFGVALGLASGALLAYLSFKLIRFAVFLQLFTMTFVAFFLMFMFTKPEVGFGVGLFFGLIIGLLGAFITKHIIIIQTCLTGAIMVGSGFYGILGIGKGKNIAIAIVVGGICGIVGVLIQFHMNKGKISAFAVERTFTPPESANPATYKVFLKPVIILILFLSLLTGFANIILPVILIPIIGLICYIRSRYLYDIWSSYQSWIQVTQNGSGVQIIKITAKPLTKLEICFMILLILIDIFTFILFGIDMYIIPLMIIVLFCYSLALKSYEYRAKSALVINTPQSPQVVVERIETPTNQSPKTESFFNGFKDKIKSMPIIQDISSQGKWICACGASNTSASNFCSKCGAKRPQADVPWICSCGRENRDRFCGSCGAEKPQNP